MESKHQNLKCSQIQTQGKRTEDKYSGVECIEHELASGKFYHNSICANGLPLNSSQYFISSSCQSNIIRVLILLENMVEMRRTYSLRISSCFSRSVREETAANSVVSQQQKGYCFGGFFCLEIRVYQSYYSLIILVLHIRVGQALLQ